MHLDLRRVLTHPGFVEISRWQIMPEPVAIGLRLGDGPTITWFHGDTIDATLQRAIRGIELLGTRVA
jgi:hypothetical protein